MKQLSLSTLIFFLTISFFVSGCKDATKTDTEKEKTKVADTTKKNTVNADETVKAIQKYRADGEEKLTKNLLAKKEVSFKGDNIKENIKQKWDKMDVYSDGGNIVRLQLYPYKNISSRTEEFYIKDGKLVFAFIQDKGPKHEGSDTGEPGKEFYFDNDKLIKYVNTSGEESKSGDDEKKMYESRLPFEVKELLEIAKTVK